MYSSKRDEQNINKLYDRLTKKKVENTESILEREKPESLGRYQVKR